MLGWALNLGFGGGGAAVASAELTGLLSDGVSEHDLASKWQDVGINLSNETFVSGTTFNDAKQALIDGFDSANAEEFGWNAIVRDRLSIASITRVSDTRVTIQMQAFGGFAIDLNETITVTLPASILAGASEVTATPTFTVTASDVLGNVISNAGATIPAVSGFTIDDRTGFKVLPGELVTDGHIEGLRVTAKRRDDRHPQENLRAFTDELRGSVSPEQDDTFITEDIDPDDL